MTPDQIDAFNRRALNTLDGCGCPPGYRHLPDCVEVTGVALPLDEPRHRYPISDREAWENANQHELQRDWKW